MRSAIWFPLFFLLLPLGAVAQSHASAVPSRSTAATNGSHGPAAAANREKAPALLPAAFAGLPREGDIVIQPTAADADSAHAAVLKEDGLVEADTARYAGPASQNSWSVEILRFGDATGALSAWTFFHDPAMRPQAMGNNAAANQSEFLAQKSVALVIVRKTGSTGDAMQLSSAVQLLLQGLPLPTGPEAVLPTLPGLLPADGLQKQTLHYAIGPAGYNGPIPVHAIDFGRDAEAATALYRFPSGATGTLTLLMLPTPQIAGAELHAITALPDPALHIATRRIGPLVGVVSGATVSQAQAQRLLNEIHYVADVTMDQPQGYVSEVAKAAKLLLGIGYLTVLLALAALVVAVFLGSGRALVRRMRGKPASSVTDDEFITLKL